MNVNHGQKVKDMYMSLSCILHVDLYSMDLNLIYILHFIFLFSAVLNGDLKLFNQVIDKFKEKFLSEKTYTLIIRLIFCLFVTCLFASIVLITKYSMLFTENANGIIIFFDCQVAAQCD